MALLGSFTKQSREILDCDISYVPVLADGVNITGTPTAEVTPTGAGAISISGLQIFTGNKIKFNVSGGTDAVLYKVTILADTDTGLRYEDEVNVLVEDV